MRRFAICYNVALANPIGVSSMLTFGCEMLNALTDEYLSPLLRIVTFPEYPFSQQVERCGYTYLLLLQVLRGINLLTSMPVLLRCQHRLPAILTLPLILGENKDVIITMPYLLWLPQPPLANFRVVTKHVLSHLLQLLLVHHVAALFP
ncbi:hypothetical protein MLD38_026327 [Melastoma candidum]|uniref:Uncharacterized protein n=1 Tax=Melastoma candidum TaxID=119954 RepID=A0ACB9NZL8_9MYRT|nr:hypothetical protein MLD38_026327 [Melastoma candidum]